YFHVKDVDAFKTEMDKLLENENVEIEITDENKICMYGENFGAIFVQDEDGIEDDEEIDVFARIQNHLPDGEAVLINSIGWEKFRYMHGGSTILTATKAIYVDAESTVRQLAEEKGILTNEQLNKLVCEY